MKVYVEGKINLNYVQSLCLMYFPGEKFSENEVEGEDTPVVSVKLTNDDKACYAYAQIRVGENKAEAECTCAYNETRTALRTEKVAVATAMFNAGVKFFEYRPAWGILTGIRPGKVTAALYKELGTKAAVKKVLTNEYLLTPKKASLVTDIAVNELKILSQYGKDTCSVYISIPFCPTRCAYCSFVSYATKRLLSLIPEYLEKLICDIDEIFDIIKEKGQRVVTIYIGGGTPTTLTEAQLEILLQKIASRVDVKSLNEYTLEAGRPDTITEEKLKIAKEYGVTRISINPQTLNDKVLQGIGRNHTAAEFFHAFELARNAGIECINTDLIAGLPGEGFKSFSKSVDEIIKLRPENITVHTFCVKKAAEVRNTNLNIYSRNGGEAVKCVDYSQVMAINAGYIPYYIYRQKNCVGNLENVGFSVNGKEGLYNILMMEETHCIYAAGAGAVTKLISSDGEIKRFFMPKYPFEYLDPDRSDKKEAVFNGIREFQI